MNAMLPTPAEMVAHLDRFALGQARAKQDLAVAVYNHYLSQAYREREGRDLGHHHLLLIGPTGVGKTHLVRTLASFLGVPIGFASAAGLVEAGYKGNSVETIIRTLLERAGGDPRRAERGILFVDEIDKIRRGETHGGRDVSGEGVQNALLTLLDGRLSQGLEGWSHASVDTGRLLFICTGAYGPGSWSDEQYWNAIERLKTEKLGWGKVAAAARAWWQSFETDSRARPALVYRVCEELAKRDAGIGELFLAFRYSRTDNIQANLHYLDYMRLKEADAKKAPKD